MSASQPPLAKPLDQERRDDPDMLTMAGDISRGRLQGSPALETALCPLVGQRPCGSPRQAGEAGLGHICPLRTSSPSSMPSPPAFTPQPSQTTSPSLDGGWAIGEGRVHRMTPFPCGSEDRTQKMWPGQPLTLRPTWDSCALQVGLSPGSPLGSRHLPIPQSLLGTPRSSGTPCESGWGNWRLQ